MFRFYPYPSRLRHCTVTLVNKAHYWAKKRIYHYNKTWQTKAWGDFAYDIYCSASGKEDATTMQIYGHTINTKRGKLAHIWGLCHLKQVHQAGISNYIPQFTVGCNYLSLPGIPVSGDKVHIRVLLFLWFIVLKWPSRIWVSWSHLPTDRR